jgi:hypothetical protein
MAHSSTASGEGELSDLMLSHRVCAELYTFTEGRPSRAAMVRSIAQRLEVGEAEMDRAVELAVARGWLRHRRPHVILLCEEGRQMLAAAGPLPRNGRTGI